MLMRRRRKGKMRRSWKQQLEGTVRGSWLQLDQEWQLDLAAPLGALTLCRGWPETDCKREGSLEESSQPYRPYPPCWGSA